MKRHALSSRNTIHCSQESKPSRNPALQWLLLTTLEARALEVSAIRGIGYLIAGPRYYR
jgi:hypothetical protein